MEGSKIPFQSNQSNSNDVSDIMSKVFQPTPSGDHEILEIVAKYSLQVSPRQQFALNRLRIIANDSRVSSEMKQTILDFIEDWQNMKRYHDSLPFIGRTISDMSLRRWVEGGQMKGQVIKTQ